jgi:epoxyqueuosine reductase
MNFADSPSSASITDLLNQLAAEAGLDAAGIVPLLAEDAASPTHAATAPDYPELLHLEDWVAQGHAGDMEYLKRRTPAGRLQRERVQSSLPWARSVIVCALNYHPAQPTSCDPAPPDAGWIARYAWSGAGNEATDYHQVLLGKLRQVERGLQQQISGFESRCYVDTGPLVERVYARHAGLGWVGKNTCLIREGLGSWIFLGVIITSMKALPEYAESSLAGLKASSPALAADRCGSCTLCIDACPTDAIVAPYQLDASRCIAYLTIEKRGSIPEPLRVGMGRNVFGCDICQDVCPWNKKAPISLDPEMQTRSALVNPALDWLASLTHAEFRRIFRGSPVERKRYKGMAYKAMRRNVAIAMGNSGQQQFMPQLRLWAESADPVLAESAQWAIEKIKAAAPAIC